jgi:t-SNARE complex subunit (syntaxin)
VDQSKYLAARAKEDSQGKMKYAVIRCFELLFGRQPDATELSIAVSVAEDSGLEIVCRSLINSNEFAFLP